MIAAATAAAAAEKCACDWTRVSVKIAGEDLMGCGDGDGGAGFCVWLAQVLESQIEDFLCQCCHRKTQSSPSTPPSQPQKYAHGDGGIVADYALKSLEALVKHSMHISVAPLET